MIDYVLSEDYAKYSKTLKARGLTFKPFAEMQTAFSYPYIAACASPKVPQHSLRFFKSLTTFQEPCDSGG